MTLQEKNAEYIMDLLRIREEAQAKMKELVDKATKDVKEPALPEDCREAQLEDLEKLYPVKGEYSPYYFSEPVPEDKTIFNKEYGRVEVDKDYAIDQGYKLHRLVTAVQLVDVNELLADFDMLSKAKAKVLKEMAERIEHMEPDMADKIEYGIKLEDYMFKLFAYRFIAKKMCRIINLDETMGWIP